MWWTTIILRIVNKGEIVMSTNKEVIKLETIRTLAELFPEMTVVDLLEWIEYCKTLSKEVVNNDY